MKKPLLILILIIFIGLFSQESNKENNKENKFYHNKKTHINIAGGFFFPNSYNAYPVSVLLEYRFFKFFSAGGEFIFYASNKDIYDNFPFFGNKIRINFNIPFFIFDLYLGTSFNFYIQNNSPEVGVSFYSGIRIGSDFIGVSLENGIESLKKSSYFISGLYLRF